MTLLSDPVKAICADCYDEPCILKKYKDFSLVVFEVEYDFPNILEEFLMALVEGAVHKRRHQSRGRGVNQNMILLYKFFSKSDDEGGRGVKNLLKLMTSFMNGP